MPISLVEQVLPLPIISKIPNSSPNIEGIINFHGILVKVVNLKKYLDLSDTIEKKVEHIIIIEYKKKLYGLIVDTIIENFQEIKSNIHKLPLIFENFNDLIYLNEIIIHEEQIFLELNLKSIVGSI